MTNESNDNKKKGYIKLYRSILDNPIYDSKEPFTKRGAWMDLLLNVNHSDQKVVLGNRIYDVKKGDTIKAKKTWATRWRWSRDKVSSFFKLLVKMRMITVKTDTKTTHITICNYDSYNGVPTSNRQRSDNVPTSNRHQTDTNKKEENVNNEKNVNNSTTTTEKKKIEILEKIEAFKNNILEDKYFSEPTCMKYRFNFEKFTELLESFVLEKKAILSEWENYADFQKNFMYWIPKNLSNGKAKFTNKKNRNQRPVATPDSVKETLERFRDEGIQEAEM